MYGNIICLPFLSVLATFSDLSRLCPKNVDSFLLPSIQLGLRFSFLDVNLLIHSPLQAIHFSLQDVLDSALRLVDLTHLLPIDALNRLAVAAHA